MGIAAEVAAEEVGVDLFEVDGGGGGVYERGEVVVCLGLGV